MEVSEEWRIRRSNPISGRCPNNYRLEMRKRKCIDLDYRPLLENHERSPENGSKLVTCPKPDFGGDFGGRSQGISAGMRTRSLFSFPERKIKAPREGAGVQA